MKFLYPCALVIILSIQIIGQADKIVEVAVNKSDPRAGKSGKDDPGSKSKVVIPPEKAKPITVPKFAVAIAIDGRPDEDSWKQAAVFKDFVQTAPGDNIAPSKQTEVLMMYDEKNLYVAFRCWDDQGKVRASVAKRDEIFGEDNVRMWLDTYNDQRRAYVIAFNPLGIQQDGIYTEGQGADFSVDIVMESKGVIEDWGWSVEAKIPFKSLRYAAGKGKMWGFNVARNIDRFNDEFDQWLPDDRNISGFLIKHGKITGLDEIKYERTLEIVPSITISQTGGRVQANEIAAGRWLNQPIKQDIGVNLKYTLSPNVTLDATINPDFAEIEADAPVITANQRFPIFFQEKRPFFLEGQDIFQTPFQIFYSRTIVDPEFAAKLTGKTGKNTFGFMVASDKAPGNYEENDRNDPFVRPRIDEFLDKSALFGVFRVKRDFGKENNIGFFATYRSFPEQKNLVLSLDGRFKLNPKLTSQFQLIGTNSRRCFFNAEFEPLVDTEGATRNSQICGGGTFGDVTLAGNPYQQYRTGNGLGYYFNLDYSEKNRGWFMEVGGRSKDYRADSGFTRRTNTNFAFFANRLSSNSKPKASIIRINSRQFTGLDYDWKGRLQGWNLGSNVNVALQKSFFLFAEAGIFYEKLYEEEFGLKRAPTRPLGTFLGDPTRGTWQQYFSGNVNQTVNKKFNYGFFIGFINNSFDYFGRNSGQQDPQPGKQFDAEVWGEYKPIDPLRFSFNYRKSRLVRNDNRIRAFDSDLITVRSTYQFTRFLYTRMRVDYDSASRNYSGQLLFGWNPSPGKAFYVGYNDNFNYYGFNPFTDLREPGFQRNSRTFFIRASYLFRKSF
ncbi:MAG: DUF5916 domain-containing protein [Acidobacteriota bacterium]